MPVTGNDEIGTSRDRAGEHMIVVSISGNDTRHINGRCHGCETPDLAYDAKRRQSRRRQPPGELFARHDIEQFRHQHRAGAQFEDLSPGIVKQKPGRTVWGKQCRDQRIGIEHDAHG